MTDIDLRDRESFVHWVTHTIRYNDQDPVGHVNNVAMATFFEQGRTSFVYPLIQRLGPATLDIVLARLVIDYLAELGYPGTVDIGSRLQRIGNRSFTLVHGVFKGDSDACVATGEAVLVFFDREARRSVEPPPPLRREMLRIAAASAQSGSANT